MKKFKKSEIAIYAIALMLVTLIIQHSIIKLKKHIQKMLKT